MADDALRSLMRAEAFFSLPIRIKNEKEERKNREKNEEKIKS